MAVNKYVGDYRLVEDVDERGRIRTSTEYIGADYVYLLAAGPRAREVRTVVAATVLAWACWVGALLPFSAAMQHMYVSLPFVFAAIPLAVATGVVIDIVRRSEPLEHRHADRIRNRYPAGPAICGMLVAFALVGAVVSVVLAGGPLVGDLVFLACDALLLACAALLFSKKDAFAVREAQ